MSYTDQVKRELSEIPLKSSCCRRSLGAGLAYCSPGTGEGKFKLILPDAELGEFAARMLAERFRTNININIKLSKEGRATLNFASESISALVAAGRAKEEFRCPNCEAAFLRGVFIASASVSDPHSAAYHAEFLIPDARGAKVVYELLAEAGDPPKIIERRGGSGLYFKDSEKIEELLVRLGANSAAFELMNCKIERNIRNDENRATNCVTQNIKRTVSASHRQVEDIIKLTESGRLEAMPYDIRVTAKLRLENPEASLAELAALHKPPISKSGLNHRLEKISAEAEKII